MVLAQMKNYWVKPSAPEGMNTFLASKCGLFKDSEGKREINGRPEVIKSTCEDSLQRLKTDYIDLYYLHRLDRQVPIEESVGALSDLVKEGKIGQIGLSEVSAETLTQSACYSSDRRFAK